MSVRFLRAAGLCLCLSACAAGIGTEPATVGLPGRISAHVSELASDAYGGRAPGTEGETKTVAYIAAQFAGAGLQPGNRGSWFQDVPIMRVEPGDGSLTLSGGPAAPVTLRQKENVMLLSGRAEPIAAVEQSDLVFVGYGIAAPQLKRDDYRGVDVRGRTLLMLPWAPNGPDFAGSARFQYGLPMLKVAEAARRGAAAVLIMVPDGESWDQSIAAVRQRTLTFAPTAPATGPAIEGRIKRSAVERLLGASRLAQLEQAAAKAEFRPLTLGLTASARVESDIQRFNSRNVVGLLPGTDRPQEHLLFVAHWDAYGHCPPDARGDGICNGALDNASGVGGLIELARLFGSGERLPRSLLFLATTAEEVGLLGATFYAADPALPLGDMVAGATLDMIAGRERGTDLVLFGKGLSDLDPYFERAAARQGRRVVAPTPEDANYFERSDNIVFVRKGVPVLTPSGLWAKGLGRDFLESYEKLHYHRPSDEAGLIASFDGAAEDVELLHAFGRDLASSTDWPEWRENSPYRGRRAARQTAKIGE